MLNPLACAYPQRKLLPLLFEGKKPDSELDGIRRQWEQNADSWSSVASSGGNQFHKLFLYPAIDQFLGPVKSQTILDLGCGEGTFCRRFAKAGAESVVGVDISRKLVEKGRQTEKADPLGVRYKAASFSQLKGIRDNSFDRVFSNMAFMLAPDLKSVFEEAYRVLKPGGEFVFITRHPFTLRPRGGANGASHTSNGLGNMHATSYFNQQPFQHVTRLGIGMKEANEITSTYYQRTISDYLNPLLQSGFEISETAEPYPTREALDQEPELKHWSMEPFCLMVKARKPG